VSDLARSKTHGVPLLARQAVDDRVADGHVKWRVLRDACTRYFPANGSAVGLDSDRSAPLLAEQLRSVLRLCLEALLAFADYEHYSPCGHQVLAAADTNRM